MSLISVPCSAVNHDFLGRSQNQFIEERNAQCSGNELADEFERKFEPEISEDVNNLVNGNVVAPDKFMLFLYFMLVEYDFTDNNRENLVRILYIGGLVMFYVFNGQPGLVAIKNYLRNNVGNGNVDAVNLRNELVNMILQQ